MTDIAATRTPRRNQAKFFKGVHFILEVYRKDSGQNGSQRELRKH